MPNQLIWTLTLGRVMAALPDVQEIAELSPAASEVFLAITRDEQHLLSNEELEIAAQLSTLGILHPEFAD